MEAGATVKAMMRGGQVLETADRFVLFFFLNVDHF